MAGTSTDGVPDLTAEIAAGEEEPLPPPAVNEEDVYDPSDIYGLNRNAALVALFPAVQRTGALCRRIPHLARMTQTLQR